MLRLREPFSRKVRLHIRQQLLQQLWDKYVPSASAEYERIQLIYLGEKDGQETGQARRVQLLVNLVLHNRMIQAGLSGSPMKTITVQKPMVNHMRRLEKCFLTQLRCCNLTLYRNVSRTITLLRQAEEEGRRFRSWQKENQTIERQWKEYRLCSAFSSDMENFLTEYSVQTARTLEKELLLALTEKEYGLLVKKLDNMAEPKEFMLQYIDVMGEAEIRQLWLQMEGLAQQEGSLAADFGDGQADSIFREKLTKVQKQYEHEVVRGFYERVSFIINENLYRMPDDMEKQLEGELYQAIAELVNISEEKTYRLSDITQMMEAVQRRLIEQKERIERREVLAFETYRELYQEALGLEEVASEKDKGQRYQALASERAMLQSQEDIIWLVEERYRKQHQGEMSEEELKNICEYGRIFIKLLKSFPEQQKEINQQMEMKGQGLEAFSVELREKDVQDILKDQRSREMLEQLFELSEDQRTEFIRNLADIIHIWYQVSTSLQYAEPETVKGRLLPEATRLEDVSAQELFTENELELPAIQSLIHYVRSLNNEQYRTLLKELSEVMRLQWTLSFGEGTDEEAGQSVTESENQEISLSDRTKRDEASPQRLWEWAEALLFYPKTATSLDATTIDESSQTEIIRRQIEISKDRNNLRQLISQINHVLSVEADTESHTLSVEADTEEISWLDYAEGQAETPVVQKLLRYIQTLDEKQYGVLVGKLSQVIKVQSMLSLSDGSREEAVREPEQKNFYQKLWEWGETLLFYTKDASSEESRAVEVAQTEAILRQIEMPKDRDNLRRLISQINRTLSEGTDTEKISRLVYAENQLEMPEIQKLLSYVQTLNEEQYVELVKELSQVTKVQNMLSLGASFEEEAAKEAEKTDRTKRVEKSRLWEWGKALLFYPKTAASLDNNSINEAALSAEDRNHEIPQTEVIRRQIEISKDQSNLRRLISQINHTLSLESDTENLLQLDYAESQVETPVIQNLLHHIQTLDEEKYGVLVKELSQVAKVQSSEIWEWGEALLDVTEHRQEWRKADEVSGALQTADLEYTDKKDSDRAYLQQMIRQLNHMALLPGTSEVPKAPEPNEDEGIQKGRDGYARRSGWLLHKDNPLKRPQVQNLLSYIHGLDKALKQRRMEQKPSALTYPELAQRIWQYETGRRKTELLNTKLTGEDMFIPIETSVSMDKVDKASEPDKAFPERKPRTFQIGYPASELAYTAQNPDTSREEHQRTEMRLKEENSQIKSAQEQLGRKLAEVEKQLKDVEGATKARQDVRSFADQVKRQLYEELHVEKLRRGLI